MIAERIYCGETAEDIGISELQFLSRKQALEQFLEETPVVEDFARQYLEWVSQSDYGSGQPVSTESSCCEDRQVAPSLSEKVAGFGANMKQLVSSRFEAVSEEERIRRYSLCQECQWFKNYRCMQCGCFMKIKSKFAAMRCPIGLW
jgi:hypothetical protein